MFHDEKSQSSEKNISLKKFEKHQEHLQRTKLCMQRKYFFSKFLREILFLQTCQYSVILFKNRY